MELYWKRGLPGIGFVVVGRDGKHWRAEAGFWSRAQANLKYQPFRAPEELEKEFGVSARDLVVESAQSWCNLEGWTQDRSAPDLLTLDSSPLQPQQIGTVLLSTAFHWPDFLERCQAAFKNSEFLEVCGRLKEPAQRLREISKG